VTDLELPTGPLEYRSAQTLEVRHAERTIDLLAVPYDEETEVSYRGRWIMESVAPGAFAGVSGDVTVNRAHDLERPLGMVRKFHPGDPRGLRTELRISRTRSGDDVLELADDGLLGASVAFAILPNGEQWSADRRSRKVTRARLAHIALTGDPAYRGAKVLAVRTAGDDTPTKIATPNLDRLRLEMLAERSGFDLSSTTS
jgi:HK97 family phage prohead protease